MRTLPDRSPRSLYPRSFWLGAAALLAACGGSGGTDTPKGDPLTGAAGTWTWNDVAGMVCDDGTPTGVGVSPSPTGSKDVLVYFMGGGACWDYLTCATINASTHGPYGRAQFEPSVAGTTGTVLDRAPAAAPFRDYNLVFVPYCTGDLHAGDRVATYTSGTQQRVIQHKGRANVLALLPRIAATWPGVRKLVVTGSSAGGFGASLNYDVIRPALAPEQSYLIDDSGPSLVGEAVPKVLRDAWYTQWSLGQTAGTACTGCQDDFSLIYPALQQKYPSDRMSLLSYTQDAVIRAYLGNVSETNFQTSLYQLSASRFDASAQSRVFFVTGTSHVLLGNPGSISSQGTMLNTFLTRQVTDDAAWASVKP